MTRAKNPVTDAYNEQERLRLQREAAEIPSANAEGEEQIDETAQSAFSDERSVAAGRPGGSWAELADQQRADAETAQINANRQAFDQYVAIEDGAKQQKLALDHQRAIAGAAMIQSAFRNGGMSDRSLSAAFSQAFGRPIYGGQLVKGVDIGNGPETVFAMYGAAKDPATGKATVAPVAMMGSREMLQIMKRAGLGDATNDLQNDIIDNSYLGKLTDDQRAAMGVSRPSAPISTGTTVISGAAMRRLRGIPRQPGAVSHFAADGRGGFSQSYHNFRTGENWSVDYGTRSPDYQGRWKVLESGPDGMRYENDKTGEVVRVPKGENLRDVLRGTSEKEKIARIQAQGRTDAAAIRAAGRGTAGAGAGAVKVDKDLIAAVKEMRAAYAPKMLNDDDEMVDNPNADPEMFKRYSDRLNQLLLGGGEGVSDGGEGTQGGMSGVDAKRQELIRRGLLNPDGTPKQPVADNGGQQSGTARQQETTTQQKQPVGNENPGANSPTKTEEPPDESRRFVDSGGEYSEDEDTGLRRVKIRNWDYLSPEEQQGWNEEMQESEGDSEGLMMGSIADLQERANARKSEVDKKWEAEAQRLEVEWKRRGWTQKRIDNALDKAEEKWRLVNDPAAKRRRRENENKIRGFFPQ